MYEAYLERAASEIRALRQHVETSEQLRALIHEGRLICNVHPPCFKAMKAGDAPDRTEWRIIDHCATVTRIYAIYENFAREIISEHLSIIQNNFDFQQLPGSIQRNYRAGIAKILEKKDGPRYKSISLEEIISNYSKALFNQPYVFENAALLMHDQNLRLSELERLNGSIGIENIKSWIENHWQMKEFFETQNRLSGTAETQLSQIVQYRNDAAHGGMVVDDLLGHELLLEICDFMVVLCSVITEKSRKSAVYLLESCGSMRNFGTVGECIRDKTVVISLSSGKFAVGDTVFFCGDAYCFERIVEEIQLDGQSFPEVSCETPTEIGFRMNGACKNGAQLFQYVREEDVENSGASRDGENFWERRNH